MIYLCICEDDGSEYYASAEGYTKNKIRLKLKNAIANEGNFMSGLFKIYPAFNNNEY